MSLATQIFFALKKTTSAFPRRSANPSFSCSGKIPRISYALKISSKDMQIPQTRKEKGNLRLLKFLFPVEFRGLFRRDSVYYASRCIFKSAPGKHSRVYFYVAVKRFSLRGIVEIKVVGRVHCF